MPFLSTCAWLISASGNGMAGYAVEKPSAISSPGLLKSSPIAVYTTRAYPPAVRPRVTAEGSIGIRPGLSTSSGFQTSVPAIVRSGRSSRSTLSTASSGPATASPSLRMARKLPSAAFWSAMITGVSPNGVCSVLPSGRRKRFSDRRVALAIHFVKTAAN
ncbi:hypothetical protein GCM10009565_52870 [Amycolatopsis albidoflavus]